MAALGEWLIKFVLAPLIIEVATKFMARRNTDSEFKKRSDEVFARISSASSDAERSESAKDLQALVHS